MLILLFFGNCFLLEGVHMIVLSHIDEHLASCVHILSLHNEAFGWLDDHATIVVDMWLAVFTSLSTRLSRHLIEHVCHFRRTISLLNLLVDLHQLGICVVCRRFLCILISAFVALTCVRIERSLILLAAIHTTHMLVCLTDFSEEFLHRSRLFFKFQII